MASSARIDELRKKFDENPRRYFAPLANEYRKAGEVDQAIAICREYLPQQPGHMSGHIVYGQALYEARQFDEAKAVFETALTLDPENLIALRHLGDIALIVGDSEGARGWYRRVLDADPRNEEIQAQLRTLDQAASGAGAPTPVVSASVPPQAPAKPIPSSAPVKPTLSSAPTVVMSAVPRPGPSAPQKEQPIERPLETVTPESPTAEIRLDTIPTQAPPEVEKPVAMAIGLEPTSLPQTPEGAPSAPALEIETPVSATKEARPLDSFSLEGLETTSLASSAPPAAPAVTAAPPAPAEVAVPVLDLGESSASAAPAPPPVAQVPELDLADLGMPAAPSAPAPESGPFVTETMAELYLQQGHREEALRVYRALLEQRPDDASLRAKVAGLEAELAPSAAHTMPRREAPIPAAHAGPTIRELLALVAMRRPGFRPEVPRHNGPPTDAIVERASPLAPDAIAAFFGAPRISAEDDAAAMALAIAFIEVNGAENASPASADAREIAGAPARPAATELSLDSVFGGAQRPPPAASSFSFDQFFSQRAAAESATGPGATSSVSADAANDVAQFTQWLEGLKQR